MSPRRPRLPEPTTLLALAEEHYQSYEVTKRARMWNNAAHHVWQYNALTFDAFCVAHHNVARTRREIQ